ncbi:MAG: hypothetical protein LBO04_00120 [Spirochaetaceae bacterium]|nr:hypothetical protein [Spirochaetaceae bacterium]
MSIGAFPKLQFLEQPQLAVIMAAFIILMGDSGISVVRRSKDPGDFGTVLVLAQKLFVEDEEFARRSEKLAGAAQPSHETRSPGRINSPPLKPYPTESKIPGNTEQILVNFQLKTGPRLGKRTSAEW